jgi:hypothetical protein
VPRRLSMPAEAGQVAGRASSGFSGAGPHLNCGHIMAAQIRQPAPAPHTGSQRLRPEPVLERTAGTLTLLSEIKGAHGDCLRARVAAAHLWTLLGPEGT